MKGQAIHTHFVSHLSSLHPCDGFQVKQPSSYMCAGFTQACHTVAVGTADLTYFLNNYAAIQRCVTEPLKMLDLKRILHLQLNILFTIKLICSCNYTV